MYNFKRIKDNKINRKCNTQRLPKFGYGNCIKKRSRESGAEGRTILTLTLNK